MQSNTDRGNAAVELILIAPFFVFILMSFLHLYQKGIGAQKKVITDHLRAKQELFRDQNGLSVLERPCIVDSAICNGRKK